MGGNNINPTDVELFDLSEDIFSVCTKPANIPGEHSKGSVGAYQGGKLVLCGGEGAGKRCKHYDFKMQSWAMAEFTLVSERICAAGTVSDNGTWIVIGGEDSGGDPRATSETLENGMFRPGIIWPEAVSGHCAERLNGSHAFVAGGNGTEGDLGTSYLLDVRTSHWISVEDKMEFPRSGHVCGFGESIAVVAGGLTNLNVEILSLSKLRWSRGPRLPYELNWASSAQFKGTMFIVGGEHIGYCSQAHLCYSSNSVLEFKSERWEIKNRTLSIPRSKHVSFTLPNGLSLCQKTCADCKGESINL